ncbi:hypothetical protein B0H63DRAFT_468298 [Podospora didyma]|uniref:Oxidase ustYa n=1 Tax=Podospora didyma TaxID=330526 RepID=A0AAE0NSC3_9PEZI|nr:hypothetical protein B0H63DRAFT_468298 [Podospora didyma]
MDNYTAIPLDEDGSATRLPKKRLLTSRNILLTTLLAAVSFALGYAAGKVGPTGSGFVAATSSQTPPSLGSNGDYPLLPEHGFIPSIPGKEVTFRFPTEYEQTGPEGDKLWDQLMPVGSGFVRVPYPRRFDMPASEPIPDDIEEGEIYSLSVTHQLHCLAVLRDVIIKYEKRDKSRFAGDGHEYHCLDYIRQSVLCAGDTTLDYADERTVGPDGQVTRYGFTGANSTHQCRDWDAIKSFVEEHRSGERTGILV